MKMEKVVNKILKPFYGTGIGNYFPFNQIYKLHHNLIMRNSKEILKTIRVKDYQFKIFINLKNGFVDKQLYVKGIHEENVTNLIISKLNKGDTFIDIGANIGYFTLLSSKIIQKKGKVFSFEPVSNIYEKLSRNVEQNKLDNVVLEKYGVGSDNKKETINYSTENLGYSSILNNKNLKKESIVEEIEIIKLDSYKFNTKINMMKIDVEGFEFEVLKGSEKILRNNKPQLIFEFSPEFYKLISKNYIEYSIKLLEFLKNLGYDIYEIKKNKLSKIDNFEQFISKLDGQADIYARAKNE